jgi:AraC family transcriptional regulator
VKKSDQAREMNRWYVDSRAELPGIVMENGSVELTQSVVRDISHPHHQVFLTFSLPDDRKTFVRMPDLGLVYGGVLSFRPANAQYRSFLGCGKYKWFRMSFDPERFPQIGSSVTKWDFQLLCNIIGSPMEPLLQRMAGEVADPGAASQALLAGLADIVLVDLLRLLKASEEKKETRGVLSQKQLQRIMEYVEKSGNASPTIQELSKVLAISARHLTRMFKASTGKTIHAYVSQERVRKAISMLTTTDLTVKEISTNLGYNAPWGFSAAFQKAMGETPTEFRRRFLANHGELDAEASSERSVSMRR